MLKKYTQSQENHMFQYVFHFSGHRKHVPADGARNLQMIPVLEHHTLWWNTTLKKKVYFYSRSITEEN